MRAAEETEGGFVVIGAGPAGLTAAYELAKLCVCPVVVEQQNLVGGLASTAQYRGTTSTWEAIASSPKWGK
jgi:protoporphyrinogen oxidase